MAARRNAGKKFALAATTALCFALIVPVQNRIDALRETLAKEDILPTQMPQAAAAAAALGGFRGIAVDILWLQADAMINERQFYQLKTYYELVALLQPNFPSVWTYNAWNMAYNISAEWTSQEEKWLWVKQGVEFAKSGLKYNSDSEDLNFYVGFLYYHKVAKNDFYAKKLQQEDGVEAYQEAYKYFRKSGDVSKKKGQTDIRTETAAMSALYNHGIVVRTGTGNVPEAMRFLNEAEEGTRRLMAQFPDDATAATLYNRIVTEKARLTGDN
jgi:hypothetical protein